MNLSLSVSSGSVDGRQLSLSCSLGAVEEDRRLKIPGEMTKQPQQQQRRGERMILRKQENKWEIIAECAKVMHIQTDRD